MKTIKQIVQTPQGHWVGDGFPVRSLFSFNQVDADIISPFLLLDYAGPHAFEPSTKPRGVGQHPHKGFETVTIVFEGELEHRDSSGGGGLIGPGDVQWMTAGSGIVHEEFHSSSFSQSGGTLEMVQLWVNLPSSSKTVAPRYQTLLNADIPEVAIGNLGSMLKPIAGVYDNTVGPAKTYSDINMWDLNLVESESIELAVPNGHNAMLIVLKGNVAINQSFSSSGSVETIIFENDGDSVTLESDTGCHLLMLTGEPINESVVGYGPFVMNTEAEIQEALSEYRSGKFGTIPAKE